MAKLNFQQPLFQFLVSHDPLEIILIFLIETSSNISYNIIIIVENNCALLNFLYNSLFTVTFPSSLLNKMFVCFFKSYTDPIKLF